MDRYFSNNNTINLTFLNNLINYILPNISSIFKKNFINNFEVEDVPDKLIKKIIEIFINHYKYFKKKKLTEANFNKFQSLLNNSIKRKKLRALTSALTFLTFDLFDINKTYEKELTYHKDTLKNYTKQLFELVEKEENLYTNIKFIKLVNKIYKELEIKLDTIYQINSIICDVLIKDNIKELKSKSILYRDNPALSYNKLYQLQTDFEMKSEYEVLCKKIHSITRDKKYKDKTKNIKEFIDFFNTFKTLYDEFEKLKNMLQLKTLYKIKILYDYIHSEDIQNNAIKNYKSIIEKYELFSNAEVYKNIYLPSCIYLYLNPEKRKEFVTDISSNQNQNTVYNIFDIYGKYKLYDLNKNYFKNSKVEYSLDIPYI
jgi:hypothetical protein